MAGTVWPWKNSMACGCCQRQRGIYMIATEISAHRDAVRLVSPLAQIWRSPGRRPPARCAAFADAAKPILRRRSSRIAVTAGYLSATAERKWPGGKRHHAEPGRTSTRSPQHSRHVPRHQAFQLLDAFHICARAEYDPVKNVAGDVRAQGVLAGEIRPPSRLAGKALRLLTHTAWAAADPVTAPVTMTRSGKGGCRVPLADGALR